MPGHRSHDHHDQRWSRYLYRFHQEHPGITSGTLGTAYSASLSPYDWALEPFGPRATRILDIACGDGPICARAPFAEWAGFDISSTELALARARGAKCLVRADAADLPVASASTPALICCMALMVVQPLADVLAEVRRALTDDGTAVALVPGHRPLGLRDLFRYAETMALVRHHRLQYPNDLALTRLETTSRRVGLMVVDDQRRRFELPLPDDEAARRFIESLYLPGVPEQRRARAAARARRWVPGTIGIPLRRITFKPTTP